MTIKEKIEKCLETIRPTLKTHNGNIELIDVDEKRGIVKVKFLGMCIGCPMSQVTLKMGIESEIMEKVPEINEVVAIGIDDEIEEENECCENLLCEHNEECESLNEDELFKKLLSK